MADDWYSQVDGKVNGPLTSRQLKQQADSGALKRESLVRKGESGRWMQCSQLKGLFVIPAPREEARSDVDDFLAQIQAAGPVTPPPVAGGSSWQSAPSTKPCPFCGEAILLAAKKCKHCGEFLEGLNAHNARKTNESDKKVLPLFLLFVFFGFIGVHAFYAGRIAQGFVFLFAPLFAFVVAFIIGPFLYAYLGAPAGLIIASIVLLSQAIFLFGDFIRIVSGVYRDGSGRQIKKWT